ncbi:uncharacterized protein LOC118438168 [Folsomia candida]|uniref:uncharacterized protein LOC118438168 n=1 Tax=Folsomia candida TaxID=158441 RepID=UPI0016054AE3|nr:uncharacterized protein LOC118438168 [Folsomia candida]
MNFFVVQVTTLLLLVGLQLGNNVVAQNLTTEGDNGGPEAFYDTITCDADEDGLIRIGTLGLRKVYYAAPQKSPFIECHRLCRGKRTKRGRQMHLAEFLNLEEQYNLSNLTFTHNCTDIRQTELWVGGIALDYLLRMHIR